METPKKTWSGWKEKELRMRVCVPFEEAVGRVFWGWKEMEFYDKRLMQESR